MAKTLGSRAVRCFQADTTGRSYVTSASKSITPYDYGNYANNTTLLSNLQSLCCSPWIRRVVST